MPDERDPRINDLIDFAIDKKPVEFQQTFNDIVTDRLAQAIDDRKVDIATHMFNEPEDVEPKEVDDTPEEEEEVEDDKDS